MKPLRATTFFLLFAGLVVLIQACSDKKPALPADLFTFTGPSPWPEVRKERIGSLLEPAMERAGVEAWLVLCRENNNDPLALHVGGENASGEAAFLFLRTDAGLHSRVYSPAGEAVALRELAIHDSVISVARTESAVERAFSWLKTMPVKSLAVNISREDEMADGLSHTQFEAVKIAADAAKIALVSSESLVYEWLSIKTPLEVDIMTKAAEVTAQWEVEAYRKIVPGKTTDADVAAYLKARIKAAGVEDAWAPDQNPNVNSGVDRGHSHATAKVIMPGDVIQTDFGIKVFGMWVTDIQRFAYVLRPGETDAPDSVKKYWEAGKQGSRIALATLKPGISGYAVDKAQREWMKANGSLPVPWSTGHPVGYVAHDVGPGLGGGQEGRTPNAQQLKTVLPGMVFAFDGFYCWPVPGGTKTISVEEMAVVGVDSARYLTSPQETLVLIR